MSPFLQISTVGDGRTCIGLSQDHMGHATTDRLPSAHFASEGSERPPFSHSPIPPFPHSPIHSVIPSFRHSFIPSVRPRIDHPEPLDLLELLAVRRTVDLDPGMPLESVAFLRDAEHEPWR